MRILCDKHSKDYLKIKPYQKDTAGQQAHKTETSVVCAHHPPILKSLKNTQYYKSAHMFTRGVRIYVLLGMSSFFSRENLNADVYGSDSLFSGE